MNWFPSRFVGHRKFLFDFFFCIFFSSLNGYIGLVYYTRIVSARTYKTKIRTQYPSPIYWRFCVTHADLHPYLLLLLLLLVFISSLLNFFCSKNIYFFYQHSFQFHKWSLNTISSFYCCTFYFFCFVCGLLCHILVLVQPLHVLYTFRHFWHRLCGQTVRHTTWCGAPASTCGSKHNPYYIFRYTTTTHIAIPHHT